MLPIVLLLLWMLALVSGSTLGGAIHVLPVLAVLAIAARLWGQRRLVAR